jgi:DNA-directed RNA polymerase specialized sigma subunit
MVKCTKKQIRQLKTALRWKIPTGQRSRIQMVLLRESRMTQPAIAEAMGVSLSTVNRRDFKTIALQIYIPAGCRQTWLKLARHVRR